MADEPAASLLEWVHTYAAPNKSCPKPEDFSDGCLAYNVLFKVGFHDDSVSPILGNNVLLKVSNVTKVMEMMENALSEVYGGVNLSYIKAMDIVRGQKRTIVNLLELVLLCAINSEQNEDVVGKIMEMEEHTQQQLMTVITTSIAKLTTDHPATPIKGSLNESFTSLLGTPICTPSFSRLLLDSPFSAKGSTRKFEMRRNSSGDALDEIASLKEKLEEVTKERSAEIASLNAKLEEAAQARSKLVAKSNALLKENKIMKAKMDDMEASVIEIRHEHNSKVEVAVAAAVAASKKNRAAELRAQKNDGLRLLHEKNDELEELQDQVKQLEQSLKVAKQNHQNDLMRFKQERRDFVDTLDIAESKAKRLDVAESTVARFRQRISEVETLKTSLQEMTTSRDLSLEKTIGLELQLKQVHMLKEQVANHKAKIVEMTMQSTALKRELQGEVLEKTTLKKSLEELQENHSLTTVRVQSLESEVESFEFLKAEAELKQIDQELVTPELRERIIRLEMENRKFSEEKVSLVKPEDMQALRDELEIAQKVAKESENQILDLAKQVRTLEAEARAPLMPAAKKTAKIDVRAKEMIIEQLKIALRTKQESITKKEWRITELEAEVENLQKQRGLSDSSDKENQSKHDETRQKYSSAKRRIYKLETHIKALEKYIKQLKARNNASAQDSASLARLKKEVLHRDKVLKANDKLLNNSKKMSLDKDIANLKSTLKSAGVDV